MNEIFRRLLFLPEQASEFARDIDQLHYFVITITMIASFLVGTAALWFFIRYQRKSESQTTPFLEPSVGLEVAFIVVPLFFFLLWFAIGFKDFVKLNNPPDDAMDIYVVGKQWMWQYSYPEGPNGISTLRVPADRPVRLLITSRDVIHSFFIPALRIKRDAIPGRYTQLWFKADRPGTYPIFCAEYCGTEHSLMLGEVIVMPSDEYDRWIDDQQRGAPDRQDGSDRVALRQPGSSLREIGGRVAIQQGCVKCHTVDGTAHIGPSFFNLYGRTVRLATGETLKADEAYLTESMVDPLAKLVSGFQPVMPTYQGKLAPAETAALLEYIKSLRTERVQAERSTGPLYELKSGN